MIKRLLVLFALAMTPLFAQNQNLEQPKYWMVQNVSVKPNEISSYETSVKSMISGLNAQTTSIQWYAFVDIDHGIYTYVSPLDDFSRLDNIFGDWNAVASKLSSIHNNLNDLVNSWEMMVMASMPHLSYSPKTQSKTATYNIVEVMNVVPGKEDQFENILKQWATSFESSNVDFGWTVYKIIFGKDMPQYHIVYNGSTASSFQSQFSKSVDVGEKDKLLSGEGLNVLRSYSWYADEYAPELSKM
jgi:hypothetical protein